MKKTKRSQVRLKKVFKEVTPLLAKRHLAERHLVGWLIRMVHDSVPFVQTVFCNPNLGQTSANNTKLGLSFLL
jgi:hypothetical protein